VYTYIYVYIYTHRYIYVYIVYMGLTGVTTGANSVEEIQTALAETMRPIIILDIYVCVCPVWVPCGALPSGGWLPSGAPLRF